MRVTDDEYIEIQRIFEGSRVRQSHKSSGSPGLYPAGNQPYDFLPGKRDGVSSSDTRQDGVFPTENAKPLIYYMQQIVSADETLKEISCKIRGIEIGSLRVGAFYSASVKWVPPIVSRFSSLHPGVRLQVFEGNHYDLEEWLTNGKIDIGLMSMPVPENYDFIPLYKDTILAVLPIEHPLAGCEKVESCRFGKIPIYYPARGRRRGCLAGNERGKTEP